MVILRSIAASALCLAFVLGCVPATLTYEPVAAYRLAPGKNVTLAIEAAATWRDTGIQVRRDEVYKISSTGDWTIWGACPRVGAGGLKVENIFCMKGIWTNAYAIPSAPLASLIGKIGENGPPFLIGDSRGFVASADGNLFLGINEIDGHHGDNVGSLQVSVSLELEKPTAEELQKADLQREKERYEAAKLHSAAPTESVAAPSAQPPAYGGTEHRVALVIGNGNYKSASALRNPPNDAKLMARTLRGLGFKVIEEIDATQKQMKRAVRTFIDTVERGGGDSVALFYYAGHGVQVSGRNYLIPVDARIDGEADVDIESVEANSILRAMEFARARVNFVILDACRNNPFARSFRSSARGLARMDSPKGSLIAYATSPGDVAADGTGENSPYTLALTTAMTDRVPVERMFRDVRNKVMAVTADKQVPWESSSLIGGDFYFSRP